MRNFVAEGEHLTARSILSRLERVTPKPELEYP